MTNKIIKLCLSILLAIIAVILSGLLIAKINYHYKLYGAKKLFFEHHEQIEEIKTVIQHLKKSSGIGGVGLWDENDLVIYQNNMRYEFKTDNERFQNQKTELLFLEDSLKKNNFEGVRLTDATFEIIISGGGVLGSDFSLTEFLDEKNNNEILYYYKEHLSNNWYLTVD